MQETTSTGLTAAAGDRAEPCRRLCLTGGAALLLVGAAAAAPGAATRLATLERRRGGRLGVFAVDLETGRSLGHRMDERFKLMSTFKAFLSASILHRVAAGDDSLEAMVRYGPADLLTASPITTARIAQRAMSVGELCAAAMIRSDNAAANLLLRRIGGPARLTAFLRTVGDRTTRINNYEGHLTDQPLPTDSSTPRAVVNTIRRLLSGPVLPAWARAQWRHWMASNVVGRTRLRAALPPGWSAGDRTGTGDGICNDLAFAFRPGKAPLLLSAYYTTPGMALAEQEAVLRDVASVIVAWQA